MKKIGLIIGYGSIGKKHLKVMKKSKLFKKIFVLSSHLKNFPNLIKNFREIKKVNPDLIVICSETSNHFQQLKKIEKIIKNKKILIEKPIFSKHKKLTIKNNKVFVGYNLRFDPMLIYLKKITKNKKILKSEICCNSYLPSWRTRNYKSLYSSDMKRGGGVHLDLSHEIDYANWIFKNLKKDNIDLKKLSNLKINSFDYMNFNGTSDKSKLVNINLSYFSLKSERYIKIFLENSQIYIDLLKRVIIFTSLKNVKLVKFKKFLQIHSMKEQLKDIFSNKPKYICTYKEGLKVLEILGV